ncbi:DNA glycosylase, partial [Blyttiomyces helicus]
FRALVRSVIYQQLNGKAAATILARFVALFFPVPEGEEDLKSERFPTPQQVRNMDLAVLKSAGLSGRKAEYLHSLADRFLDGAITNEKLLTLSDAEISALLTSVKGIGQWTVDMFLIFTLRRPNVLPTGDLGVRRGMASHFGMTGAAKGKKGYLPSAAEMEAAAVLWEPYRTIGSFYMWRI